MIEQALALTVGMIDMVMVASAGESAVSGVSLVETINILLINLFAALANGGAIVAGQYIGKNNKKLGNHAAKQLLLFTFLLSIGIMIPSLLFNGSILKLFFGSIEKNVMRQARLYFYITAISYPFIALYNASAALFRSMGSSKIAMINSFIMNIINIIGNVLLIYGLGWGVRGAAIATLISRMIAALTMLYMLRNKKLILSVRSYSFKDFDFEMIKRIMKIGIPNGLENSMFQIGKIILTSLAASQGTIAIAAHAVGNSIVGLAVIPGFALGMAMTTVIARCVGANEYEQANGYIKYLLKLSLGLMLLLNILILIFLNPILGLYQLSNQTHAMAVMIMWIHGIGSMTIWSYSFTLPSAFRAAGDVKFTMTISILSMWIFRIGGSYLLCAVTDLGVISIWISMMMDWAFRSVCFLARWRSGKWKMSAVIS